MTHAVATKLSVMKYVELQYLSPASTIAEVSHLKHDATHCPTTGVQKGPRIVDLCSSASNKSSSGRCPFPALIAESRLCVRVLGHYWATGRTRIRRSIVPDLTRA
jgi:hypothetical protein